MFEVGDKVVCVDDSGPWSHNAGGVQPLKSGTLHVIREVFTSPYNGHLVVLLIGISGKIHKVWRRECGYRATRFRKLSDMQNEVLALKQQEQPA